MLKRSKGVDPLADLQVKRLVAAGESQSARRLTAYYNSIQPLHHVCQGFVYYDAAGASRTDLKVPAISVGTEFGASLPVIASISSAPYLRRWPVVGTSHVSFQEMNSYVDVETLPDGFLKSPDGKAVSVTQGTAGCKQSPIWSKVPTELVLNAAYHHLEHWIDGGGTAPAAPQFERNADGSLKCEGKGDLLGGIRLPQVAVPPGYSSGFNSGQGTCMLSGFHHDYTAAELKERYKNHIACVQKVDRATQELLKGGFILPYDGRSNKGLRCYVGRSQVIIRSPERWPRLVSVSPLNFCAMTDEGDSSRRKSTCAKHLTSFGRHKRVSRQ